MARDEIKSDNETSVGDTDWNEDVGTKETKGRQKKRERESKEVSLVVRQATHLLLHVLIQGLYGSGRSLAIISRFPIRS